VRVVVADTGPIHYLVLIEHIEILPVLFENVIIPSAVYGELARVEAPEAVRRWIQAPPAWLEVVVPPIGPRDDAMLEILDDGEKGALALAASLAADLVLMDDREAVRVARNRGYRVIGTLGILGLGADRGLLDLSDAFERIKRTNFRYRQELMDKLIRQQRAMSGNGHSSRWSHAVRSRRSRDMDLQASC
jgi:predicted nucleic acid-binding protein